MEFQAAAARFALAFFVLALCVASVSAFGVRFGLLDYPLGLALLWPVALLGMAGFVAGVVWALAAFNNNSSAHWRRGAPALLGSALLLIVPLEDLYRVQTAAPIHDISTDIEYAPPFQALLKLRAGAPNDPQYDGPKLVRYHDKEMSTAQAQKKAYPEIKPFAVLLNPHGDPEVHPVDILFWRGFERAKVMGWHIVVFDPVRGRIEATTADFWFGIKSDIVVRVRAAGKLGARLDIRIKSRVGESDLGANADRVKAYLNGLKG